MGKNWIATATERKGVLRKKLDIPDGETIPEKALDKAAKQPGKLGAEARLAKTLKGFKKK